MKITLELLREWGVQNRELSSYVRILSQLRKKDVRLSEICKWALENGGKEEFIGWMVGEEKFCEEMCNIGVSVSTSGYLGLRRGYAEKNWEVVGILICRIYKEYTDKGFNVDTKEGFVLQLALDGASKQVQDIVESCIEEGLCGITFN